MIRVAGRSRLSLAALSLVALASTLGSLYFSEVLGLVPCALCWYQRILMYPLVVVLGVAAIEDRVGVWRTALPLSALGVAIAAYHSYLQVRPAATCSLGGGCTAILYPMAGGHLTIPRLSLVGFSILTLGLVALAIGDRRARSGS